MILLRHIRDKFFSIRHDGFAVQENLSQFFESLQALRTVDYSGAIFCISQSPKLRPEAKLWPPNSNGQGLQWSCWNITIRLCRWDKSFAEISRLQNDFSQIEGVCIAWIALHWMAQVCTSQIAISRSCARRCAGIGIAATPMDRWCHWCPTGGLKEFPHPGATVHLAPDEWNPWSSLFILNHGIKEHSKKTVNR